MNRQPAMPHGRADISVIMVSYQTGDLLFAAMESVFDQDQKEAVELILIDNGNPPHVASRLKQWAQTELRLQLVSGHGNIGYARGCNLGARRAHGRYVLFLNPDSQLMTGGLRALLKAAKGLGEHWLLGCRALNPDGSDQRASRRALLTPGTAMVEALRLDRLLPRRFQGQRLNHHELPVPDDTVQVEAVSGACMMLPAATFLMAGGMDEGYFLHVEDLDLCMRLHRMKVPVYFTPHARLTHHAGSSRANPIWVEWHKTKGFLRYFRVHFGSLRWLPIVVLVSAGALLRLGLKSLRFLARYAGRVFSRKPAAEAKIRRDQRRGP